MTARVLLVEDDGVALHLLAEVMEREGYETSTANSAEAGLQALTAFDPDVVITDVRLAAMDGLELLRRVRAHDPRIQVIVVTAFGSLQSAIEAVRAGAFDYLSKPFRLDEMTRTVRRALHARSAPPAADHGDDASRGPTLVGRSAAMTDVFKAIARVAGSGATVLIHGETGTGKELVARAIHDASPRCDGPYVTVNCPSLPEGLLESELFGHVRGAFTGATQDRRGLFRTADGGTLLLDEIGDMPTGVQAKLLRVLEDREVRPVGSSESYRVDVRLLASTHQDLERAVEEGRFRRDLLYRLNTVTIEIPPLRDRLDDLALLVDALAQRHAATEAPEVTADAMEVMRAYAWPGNVRELSHVIERALALSPGRRIGRGDLPVALGEPQTQAPPPQAWTLDEVERAHILAVLRSVGGARARAAALLGIDRKTLYRKLREYELDEVEPSTSD